MLDDSRNSWLAWMDNSYNRFHKGGSNKGRGFRNTTLVIFLKDPPLSELVVSSDL